MRKSTVVVPLSIAGLVAGALMGVNSASAAPSGPVVVVSGLNNPRQLVLVGGGHGPELLIAEAGKGGPTKIGSGDQAEYVGTTGSIAAVYGPATAVDTTPTRVVTGLLSAAGPDGSFAVGADGVAARFSGGKVFPVITYAPPDVLPNPVVNAQSGKLLVSQPHASLIEAADISGYERAHDPDGQGFDSNPYSGLARTGDVLVSDAAGNDVLRVGSHGYGSVSVFHVFPNITDGACGAPGVFDPTPAFPGCNFVPTTLAQDVHGNVYVGGLASEVPGEGRVVELDPSGETVLHTWTGFTSVDGVAVGTDGSVYVSQLEGTEDHPIAPMVVGVLTKISPTGSRTNIDVPFTGGVAVDSANNVFVAAFAGSPDSGLGVPGIDTSGQIWKIHF